MSASGTAADGWIELDAVSKRYGQVEALRPLSVAFRASQTSVLLGSSGSGKSTLLRLVAGLVAPDAGAVRVGGERLDVKNVDRLRLSMGYVIQTGGLFPHLTARSNVELMARHLGHDSARRDARIRELAELTRISPSMLERFPSELSGGQRQRVSLMRALFLDPPILLLDEPLGALDPITRAELQVELREIFRALAKTVLLVTHDVREAAFFGDRLILLREGEIVQDGRFEELVTAPADPFVTQFIRAQSGPLDTFETIS